MTFRSLEPERPPREARWRAFDGVVRHVGGFREGTVKVIDPTVAEREARAAGRRRRALAEACDGHLCCSRDAAGVREMKPGHSVSCPTCENEAGLEPGKE